MGISGPGTVPYTVIHWRDIPLHSPNIQTLYMVCSSSFGPWNGQWLYIKSDLFEVEHRLQAVASSHLIHQHPNYLLMTQPHDMCRNWCINYTRTHYIYINVYMYIQPESWLRIRKLEAQGPSNSNFWMRANFHKVEGPSNSQRILSYSDRA